MPLLGLKRGIGIHRFFEVEVLAQQDVALVQGEYFAELIDEIMLAPFPRRFRISTSSSSDCRYRSAQMMSWQSVRSTAGQP